MNEERDYLKEAFKIIFLDETMLLAQKEHLLALHAYYHEKLNQEEKYKRIKNATKSNRS